MGEHNRPVNALQKAKWDSLRGVDLRHKRYIWRTDKGTFQYPKKLYGGMTRREYKIMRKAIKRGGLRGDARAQVMMHLMGETYS